MNYESTLAQVAENVFAATDVQTAKHLFIEHVSKTEVKDKDKMIAVVSDLNSLVAIHRYTANALLKFEGMGVGKKEEA